MQQHREEAQTAAVRRRMEDAARPADLQAMLLRQQVILVLTCQMVFPRLTYAYIYIPTLQKPCLKITFN